MIDEFIAQHLAAVDDLAELKVMMVALRLMEQRNSATAHLTALELAGHPALRDGLGAFPRLALENSLRRALARGTLLATSEDLNAAKFLANNEPGRALVALASETGQPTQAADLNKPDVAVVLRAVIAEIERLESLDAYPINKTDEGFIEEWLLRGYTEDELKLGVRKALHAPRRSSAPHRTLRHAATQVTAKPPTQPTPYFAQLIARTERCAEEVVAFRELHDRLPTGREFNVLKAAVGLYGLHAVIETLKRTAGKGPGAADGLLALLAEQHDAEMAVARSTTDRDARLRALIQLYESAMGLPATATVADEMRHMLDETTDTAVWQAAFAKAATEGKRNWAYVRAIVRNPSPNLLLPAPINAAAKHAFELYKRRVGMGKLDMSVAQDINLVAHKVTDVAKWNSAVDVAAAANALNWNYIKAVLTRPQGKQGGATDGTRNKRITARGGATTRREQVDYTDETRERAAGEADLAAAEFEERRRRRKTTASKE